LVRRGAIFFFLFGSEFQPGFLGVLREHFLLSMEPETELVEEWWSSGALKTRYHVLVNELLITRHGSFILNWDDGTPHIRAHYNRGSREGQYGEWHNNGQKRGEGHYKNNDFTGLWTYWWPNGQKQDEYECSNGGVINTSRHWTCNGLLEQNKVHDDYGNLVEVGEWHPRRLVKRAI
jgi:antitoxin component YwqK of YwqJK toxin-antitoxin module